MLCVQSLSHIWLCATSWTVAHQAPLSMGFPRQGYWNGLSFPTPGGLPDPGIKLQSLESPELAGGFFTTSTTWEALIILKCLDREGGSLSPYWPPCNSFQGKNISEINAAQSCMRVMAALSPNRMTSEKHTVQRQVQSYNVTSIILLEMVLSIILTKMHP